MARPYGTGAYGRGKYERTSDPWRAPAPCETGVWLPFVMGNGGGVSAAPGRLPPYGDGPYGAGPYERYAGTFTIRFPCSPGVWTPPELIA